MKKPTVDAVATEFGWVNPSTGEILVSCRGLPNQISGWRRGAKIDTSSIITQEEISVKEVIEEVLEFDQDELIQEDLGVTTTAKKETRKKK